MNYAAVDRGGEYVKVEIPADWKDITAKFENPNKDRLAPAFVKEIADVVNAQCGDTLPVSVFKDQADGTIPAGTTAYEKRGVAVKVPEWQAENCIQRICLPSRSNPSIPFDRRRSSRCSCRP